MHSYNLRPRPHRTQFITQKVIKIRKPRKKDITIFEFTQIEAPLKSEIDPPRLVRRPKLTPLEIPKALKEPNPEIEDDEPFDLWNDYPLPWIAIWSLISIAAMQVILMAIVVYKINLNDVKIFVSAMDKTPLLIEAKAQFQRLKSMITK